MTDFLSNMGPDLIPLVAIVGSLLFFAIPIVGYYAYKIHKTSATTALKQDMLNRGMSAEEIKIVLEAGTKH